MSPEMVNLIGWCMYCGLKEVKGPSADLVCSHIVITLINIPI